MNIDVQSIIDDRIPSIEQELMSIEANRKSFIYKYTLYSFIASLLVSLLCLLFTGCDLMSVCIVLGIVVPVFYIIFYYYYRDKLSSQYKSEIISKIVDVLGSEKTGCTFSFGSKESVQSPLSTAFRQCGLFEKEENDVTNIDDVVVGKIDKTDFIFAEASYCFIDYDSDGDEIQKPQFKGLLFDADFNKRFNGITLICHHMPSHLSSREFKKVTLENSELMKRFGVYSTDEVEARYILSTSLQERIMNMLTHLEKTSGESKFLMSFFNNRVLLLIPSHKNRFEASLFKKLTIKSVRDDISLIYDMSEIVGDLNLNTRIWTKE